MKYFWCESGEDGTVITEMDDGQIRARLRDVARGDWPATFLSAIPEQDSGCWMGVPPHAVVIIRGDTVLPTEKVRVTEYEL